MIEVVGAYNTAFCYTGELEEAAAGQIKAVCDQPAFIMECTLMGTNLTKSYTQFAERWFNRTRNRAMWASLRSSAR